MNSGMMMTAAKQRQAIISGGSGARSAGLTSAMLFCHRALRGDDWQGCAKAERIARPRSGARPKPVDEEEEAAVGAGCDQDDEDTWPHHIIRPQEAAADRRHFASSSSSDDCLTTGCPNPSSHPVDSKPASLTFIAKGCSSFDYSLVSSQQRVLALADGPVDSSVPAWASRRGEGVQLCLRAADSTGQCMMCKAGSADPAEALLPRQASKAHSSIVAHAGACLGRGRPSGAAVVSSSPAFLVLCRLRCSVRLQHCALVRGEVRCAHPRGSGFRAPRRSRPLIAARVRRERGAPPRDVLPVGSLLLCCRFCAARPPTRPPRAAMPAGLLFALPCPPARRCIACRNTRAR